MSTTRLRFLPTPHSQVKKGTVKGLGGPNTMLAKAAAAAAAAQKAQAEAKKARLDAARKKEEENAMRTAAREAEHSAKVSGWWGSIHVV